MIEFLRLTTTIRTFELFSYLQMPIIDYFLDGPKQPSRYNDITVVGPDPLKPWTPPVDIENEDESKYADPFQVSTKNKGSIMQE